MTDGASLFDISDRPDPHPDAPQMITPDQRSAVRNAFAQLGIVDAPAQFEIVYQLTSQRVRSPTELEARHAQILLRGLEERLRSQGIHRTGNAWADRDEETWIDKL